MIAGFLYEILKKARESDAELDVLAAILAVTVQGYTKSLGREQAAMMFYSIADDLAIDDEGSDNQNDGHEDRP